MPVVRSALITLGCLSAGLAGGCGGDSLGRHAISGTVTVDGAPLAKGTISFQAMEKQPFSSGAVIAAGKYSIPRDNGLTVGKYRVSVSAAVPGTEGKSTPIDSQPGDPPPPAKEMIPPDWNTASQHTIEVKREGPFEFPIEIATKGK